MSANPHQDLIDEATSVLSGRDRESLRSEGLKFSGPEQAKKSFTKNFGPMFEQEVRTSMRDGFNAYDNALKQIQRLGQNRDFLDALERKFDLYIITELDIEKADIDGSISNVLRPNPSDFEIVINIPAKWTDPDDPGGREMNMKLLVSVSFDRTGRIKNVMV